MNGPLIDREAPTETAFQNWARRLLMGPMPLVQQQLQDLMASRRERAKVEAEEAQFPRKLQLAGEPARVQARETRTRDIEKEERERGRRTGISALMRTLGLEEALRAETFGEAEIRPTRADLIGAGATAEETKAILPEPKAPIQRDPTKPLVTPEGKTILPAETQIPTRPTPFEDYNPVTQEPRWNEGKRRWDIVNKSVTSMELLASEASRLYPKDQAKQEAHVLQKSLEREQAVAGAKAAGAAPHRPLTEIETQALNWIEGGQMVLRRLESFTPKELSAMSGLFNRSRREAGLFLRGALPEMFGSPDEADARFAELKSLLAESEALAFERGGKQLTPMEKKTVTGFIPSRSDLTNPVVFQAKMSNLATSLGIIKEMRVWRLNAPRGAITVFNYDAALQQALTNAGLEIPSPGKKGPTTKLPSGKSIQLPSR